MFWSYRALVISRTHFWAIWAGNQSFALPISEDSLFLDSCLLLTARLLGILALSLVIWDSNFLFFSLCAYVMSFICVVKKVSVAMFKSDTVILFSQHPSIGLYYKKCSGSTEERAHLLATKMCIWYFLNLSDFSVSLKSKMKLCFCGHWSPCLGDVLLRLELKLSRIMLELQLLFVYEINSNYIVY